MILTKVIQLIMAILGSSVVLLLCSSPVVQFLVGNGTLIIVSCQFLTYDVIKKGFERHS